MSYSVPERTHIPLPAASQLQEHPGRQVNAQTPSHSYGLYRSSSTGELVHQETSSRDYFPRRPVKSDPGASLRRHICEDCGERFDRPNTLDVRTLIEMSARHVVNTTTDTQADTHQRKT